jgi:hypothetical protein
MHVVSLVCALEEYSGVVYADVVYVGVVYVGVA